MKTVLKVLAVVAVAAGIAAALYLLLRPKMEAEYIVLDNDDEEQ